MGMIVYEDGVRAVEYANFHLYIYLKLWLCHFERLIVDVYVCGFACMR